MWQDDIVEEIHRVREAYARSLNDDLDVIFEDLRQREAISGREVVNLALDHNKKGHEQAHHAQP